MQNPPCALPWRASGKVAVSTETGACGGIGLAPYAPRPQAGRSRRAGPAVRPAGKRPPTRRQRQRRQPQQRQRQPQRRRPTNAAMPRRRLALLWQSGFVPSMFCFLPRVFLPAPLQGDCEHRKERSRPAHRRGVAKHLSSISCRFRRPCAGMHGGVPPFAHPLPLIPGSCPSALSNAERPCVARAPCFGGEGGILREGLGLLVFQTALLRAIAPRGGPTPHCGVGSLRPSNPFLLNSKAGRPCVARASCFGGEGGIRTHVPLPAN